MTSSISRSRLVWTWHRLRSMPPAEVPHRLIEAGLRWRDRRGALRAEVAAWAVPDAPVPAWSMDADRLAEAVSTWEAALADERAHVIRGDFPSLGVIRPVGSRRAFDLEPESGRLLARGAPVGDAEVRRVSEMHRLQHLAWLACAGRASGDASAIEVAVDDVEHWLATYPVGEGWGWGAGIEAASRLVSMLVVAGAAGSSTWSPDRRARWWRAFYAHARFIERYPSEYSSANNHRLAELAALVVAGALAPAARESARWFEAGATGLAAEAERQVLSDGVGAEQAVAYHAYVLEWLLVAREAAHRGGRSLDGLVDRRLQAGARFLRAVQDGSGGFPHIGDDDEGVVLRASVGADNLVRSVTTLIASIYGRPDLLPPNASPDLRWALLGAPSIAQSAPMSPPSETFDVGGYTVLRRGSGDGERLVVFDHGPLGYLRTAAHGHADALSVWLHVGGLPVVVDTGVFVYNGRAAWREYTRSSLAHPTVTVDDRSQSTSTGPFNWGRRARCTLLDADLSQGEVTAEHDGYRAFGVSHRRALRLEADRLTVVDTLSGGGKHRFTVVWPFSPDIEAQAEGAGVLLSRGGEPLAYLTIRSGSGRSRIERQALQPAPGFLAAGFGRRVVAPALVHEGHGTLPITIQTVFRFAERP